MGFRESGHRQEPAAGIPGHDEGFSVDEQLGVGGRDAPSETAGHDGGRVFERDAVSAVLPPFGRDLFPSAQAAARRGLEMGPRGDPDGFFLKMQSGSGKIRHFSSSFKQTLSSG